MSDLTILATGPLTTIQDLGRTGHAALGVGQSGALDSHSYNLANRLVGNSIGAAALEVTMGGLQFISHGSLYVSVTGAPTTIRVEHTAQSMNSAFYVNAGDTLTLEIPEQGVRTYVAIRGGLDSPVVLGSRSTDTLGELGAPALIPGQHLNLADNKQEFPVTDFAPAPFTIPNPLVVPITPGPRDDWFTHDAWDALCTSEWTVTPASNRVGVRLNGPTLDRAITRELPSEGIPLGAVQVPPSGPIILLNDRPVTGGYPIIGVIARSQLSAIAQLRPGHTIRLTHATS